MASETSRSLSLWPVGSQGLFPTTELCRSTILHSIYSRNGVRGCVSPGGGTLEEQLVVLASPGICLTLPAKELPDQVKSQRTHLR